MTRFVCRWCTGPIVREDEFTRPVVRMCAGIKHFKASCMRCRENGDEYFNFSFMGRPPSCDSFELAKPPGVNMLPKGGAE